MEEKAPCHLTFFGSHILPVALFEKLLMYSFEKVKLNVNFQEKAKIQKHYQFHSSSFFSVQIHFYYYDEFLRNRIDGLRDVLSNDLKLLDPLLMGKEMGKSPADFGIEKMHIYYKGSKGVQMYFRYPSGIAEEAEKLLWEKMMEIIGRYEGGDENCLRWLNNVLIEKDGLRYFQLNELETDWILLDPLDTVTQSLSTDYFNHAGDRRVRKPHVIINEDHFNQHYIWDHQWDLRHGEARIILPRPNEVAIYIDLYEKSKAKAKALYDVELQKRSNVLYNPLLSQEEACTFYDFFEEMISAVIFSYTAIESLANSCIVEEYKHTRENNGVPTIYSKSEIERNISLRDKLKIILCEILKTPDPAQEKWWHRFKDLEKVRNGLIHLKQQESRTLYSKLLEGSFFKVIDVCKEIVGFYGKYATINKKKILNDLPYGYDCDNVSPMFMTDVDYWKEWRRMRGIPEEQAENHNIKDK